ncbi:MAG: glutamine amidotransferase family protein [Actinomycetia bacterium]|nr:glutamine amidotransferase family protein [Actinomycetes bacterium]
MSYYYEKDISGCGVSGFMNTSGKRVSGEAITTSIACMRDRENGLGGGFAGYGIYPDLPEHYVFHLMYDAEKAKRKTEEYLNELFDIEKDEPIPIRDIAEIEYKPLLWRYFLKPKKGQKVNYKGLTEEDFVVKAVMLINCQIKDAFVASSGKNMGIFKGVGFSEDIGRFFRLEEYKGYIWTSHGRFPTNTVGWWGGAHPFGLLDWSVVHNGEISSYGINKRYLENFGYKCSFFTDTEVMTYLIDLLVRKHNLPFEIVGDILASPFWDDIEREKGNKKELLEALRMIYSSVLVNGPFGVIVANRNTIMGLNDRIKLRPLVAATKGNFLYIASEESAIREICTEPDKVWMPKAGEPTIGRLKK